MDFSVVSVGDAIGAIVAHMVRLDGLILLLGDRVPSPTARWQPRAGHGRDAFASSDGERISEAQASNAMNRHSALPCGASRLRSWWPGHALGSAGIGRTSVSSLWRCDLVLATG